MNKFVGAALAVVMAGSSAAIAQEVEPFKLSGSIRLRYEAIDGHPRAVGKTDDNLFNARVRLLAEYDPAGPLRFAAELNDSRVDLEDSRTPISTAEVNTAEFVQVYAGGAWKTKNGTALAVQAGRFTLNLGSRRLVASDEFRNTTNSYAGLRLDAGDAGGPSATMVLVSPVTRLPSDLPALRRGAYEFDRQGDDATLFGAVATAPVNAARAALQASYFRFEEQDRADEATRDRALDTFGLRFFRDAARGETDFDVELMVQTGQISASAALAAAKQDVLAHFVHAEFGKGWAGALRPHLSLEIDYASGDRPGGDYQRFDTLFGARSVEFSPSGLYAAIGRANLVSSGLRLDLEPEARWQAMLMWKALYLASRTDSFSTSGVRDASGRSGAFAGHQFDARARYWLAPQKWRADLTGAYLAKGRFLERAPNVATAKDAAYVALDLSWMF